jgi:hypothetical protein
MIIQNKRTMEKLSLSQKEFFEKHFNEIQDALFAYIKIEQNKKIYLKRNKAELENDFYFNLQWNFNHFSNSYWFIVAI